MIAWLGGSAALEISGGCDNDESSFEVLLSIVMK